MNLTLKDEHERGDKYKVFRRLSTARYKGWSSKVLGTGNNFTNILLPAFFNKIVFPSFIVLTNQHFSYFFV